MDNGWIAIVSRDNDCGGRNRGEKMRIWASLTNITGVEDFMLLCFLRAYHAI